MMFQDPRYLFHLAIHQHRQATQGQAGGTNKNKKKQKKKNKKR
jgi:hypothetical protein